MTGAVQLSPAVSWSDCGTHHFLASDVVLRLDDPSRWVASVLLALSRGCSVEELLALGQPGVVQKVLEMLTSLDFVVPAFDGRWKTTRFERSVQWLAAHGIDADKAQQRICNAHVAIVGVGGIGLVVSQHLVGAGVRKLTLIDSDRVELHNLNRQLLYGVWNVGERKVLAAREAHLRSDPDLQVQAIDREIQAAGELLDHLPSPPWQLIIWAADRPAGQCDYLARAAADTTRVPVIAGSCGFNVGMWGPLLKPDSELEWPPSRPAELVAASGSLPMSASSGPTNALVASHLALDAVRFLAGLEPSCDGHLVTVRFDPLGVLRTPLTRTESPQE